MPLKYKSTRYTGSLKWVMIESLNTVAAVMVNNHGLIVDACSAYYDSIGWNFRTVFKNRTIHRVKTKRGWYYYADTNR